MAVPPVLSGYGPVGASSASVPFFEGKREYFADFSYKLRAVLLEHNINDIIFNPTAFQKQCDIVTRKASLRSASLPKDPADDNEQQRAARNILLTLIQKFQLWTSLIREVLSVCSSSRFLFLFSCSVIPSAAC